MDTRLGKKVLKMHQEDTERKEDLLALYDTRQEILAGKSRGRLVNKLRNDMDDMRYFITNHALVNALARHQYQK